MRDFSVYTCLIERDGTVLFTSKERGIKPLITLLESGIEVQGGCAYDKIVGRAAAFLYLLLGVKKVCAEVMSEGGRQLLESRGIVTEANAFPVRIVNRKGTGNCPMEEAVAGSTAPEEALIAIKATLIKLQQKETGV